jgi:hypothetical protein
MNNYLHITNGDGAVQQMIEAGIKGTHLPWRDVLHIGPVPADLPLTKLSDVRARFLSSLNWGEYNDIRVSFKQRDSIFHQLKEFQSITLWFEHDLYDQLQLLQILAELEQQPDCHQKLSIIQTSNYLGYHTIDEFSALRDIAKPVTDEQLALGKVAWQAFRNPTPETWYQLRDKEISALPFLQSTVIRTLKELPDASTGITQTEQMILSVLAKHPLSKPEIFKQYCTIEPDLFWGDLGFFQVIDLLQTDKPALIQQTEDKLALTSEGESVLNDHHKWQRQYSKPHWLGGYNFNSGTRYFWSNKSNSLSKKLM